MMTGGWVNTMAARDSSLPTMCNWTKSLSPGVSFELDLTMYCWPSVSNVQIIFNSTLQYRVPMKSQE